LQRAETLALRIEEHLAYLDEDPNNEAAEHWRHEIRVFTDQIRDLLPQMGKKTAAGWQGRLDAWQRRQELSP
jgi:hypothetical protein